MTTQAYTEALEKALGRVIADAQRKIETISIRAEASLAALQARAETAEARLAAIESRADDRVRERLSAVSDGKDGAPGPRGEQGMPGEKGDQGAPGERGQQGERGEPGPPGKDGAPGAPGADGKSVSIEDVRPVVAEEVARAVAELPPPVAGKDGRDGKSVTIDDVMPPLIAAVERIAASIPVPRDGVSGRDGAPGERGEKGERGIPGEAGQRGEAGERGEKGDAGERGERGERGPEGPAGKLPVVKAWAEGVYYEAAVVTHLGATWQALRDTGREPPSDDWIQIAAPGANGRSFEVRGTYDPSAAYKQHDIVMLNGSSFVALADNPASPPGEGDAWRLWAGRGKTGKPGERGPQGEKGEPGRDGVSIVAFYRDGEEIVLTMSDGVELRA